MVGLGKQALEWRITSPDNKDKPVSENAFPFSGSDLLIRYISSLYPDMEGIRQFPFLYPKVRLSWTGSKVELVELVYALDAAGCFNHGDATIKEIVTYIEIMFNIDLGDYYHTFMEIRSRKNGTAFLDKLIKVLNDRMEEADRKK